ncbi:leucine-rich repeat protein 1-like [Lycorma delicatula]|uniref:leucine-rich repeat protein 1-like n=1 Tax=Lycorma delicatula TaxID=130591 RepID=UPI003F5183FF
MKKMPEFVTKQFMAIAPCRLSRYLYISNNKLKSLPATLRSLRLSYLDFSNNEFLNLNTAFKEYKKEDFHLSVPFLRELSALASIFYRIHYGNSDIPVTLQEYLAETSECFCRNPTFTNMPEDYVQFTPRLCIVNVVNKTPDRPAIFKLHYCTYKCYAKSRTSVHTFPFF